MDWNTYSEINNSGFEVQKAIKGSNEFQTIAFIKGKGNSTAEQSYRFVDNNPLPGDNIYRLKQIDYDGSGSLSSTIVVRVDSNQSLSVSPNPSTSLNPRIHIYTDINMETPITIFSMEGRKVYEIRKNLVPGENVIEIGEGILSPGIYLATCSSVNGMLKTKFIVH